MNSVYFVAGCATVMIGYGCALMGLHHLPHAIYAMAIINVIAAAADAVIKAVANRKP